MKSDAIYFMNSFTFQIFNIFKWAIFIWKSIQNEKKKKNHSIDNMVININWYTDTDTDTDTDNLYR